MRRIVIILVLIALSAATPGFMVSLIAAQVPSSNFPSYMSAQDAAKLRIARIYPGAGSVLSWIEWRMGTVDAKKNIMDYAVNRLHANALMIHWRRQPVSWDPRDQLESPLNSGALNPKYVVHLDQWVALAKQYNVHLIFEEWFSPMLAQSRGEWTGFNDSVFQQHWQNFYYALAKHFAGNTTIAGFVPNEDVVQNDAWPYTVSGSVSFNNLWNAKMTNLSLAVHQGDPNFNFIAEVTIDWSSGYYTLGSKALYPNAWQPLKDMNPHVAYRAQWNPSNVIKSDSSYPLDGGVVNGGANWIKETGLPLTLSIEVNSAWIWDAAAFKWETDVLNRLASLGIGFDFCIYENQTSTDLNPNALFDQYGNELQWGVIFGNWAASQTTTTTTSTTSTSTATSQQSTTTASQTTTVSIAGSITSVTNSPNSVSLGKTERFDVTIKNAGNIAWSSASITVKIYAPDGSLYTTLSLGISDIQPDRLYNYKLSWDVPSKAPRGMYHFNVYLNYESTLLASSTGYTVTVK